jgi:hypothetical protein
LGKPELGKPILIKALIIFVKAPDDTANQTLSYGPILNFQTVSAFGQNSTIFSNKSMSESMEYLLANTPHSFHNLIRYHTIPTIF